MANFQFISCFRSLFMQRTSAPLLRFAILAIALALPLALLLPSLLSSCIAPGPIFLYAQLLILAIVLSSSSSAPSRNSFRFSTSPSSNSCDVSGYSASALQLIHPSHPSSQSSLQWKKTQILGPQWPFPGSELVGSDSRSTPAAGVPPSCRKPTVVPIFSLPIAPKCPPALAQTLALVPDQEENELAFSPQQLKEQQEKKQLVIRQLDQKQHGVPAWTVGRRSRSKSDERNFNPAAAPTKTLRRAETMDEASMVLRAHGDEKLSSLAVTAVLPIERVTDDDPGDDLNKRCEEFIAKGLAKMRKELLECAD